MNLKAVSLALLGALLALPVSTEIGQAQGGRDNPLDPTPSRRQILIGPSFAINRNYHTGGFRTLEGATCPFFDDGTGWGYSVGLSAEFLPSINGHWGIIPRITFEQRPGQFTQELPNAKVLLEDPVTGDKEVVDQTVSTTSVIDYTLLNMEVLYKYEIVTMGSFRVAVAGGPAFQYVMAGRNRQVQDLEEPQNARFLNPDNFVTENNGRTLVFFDDDIPQRNATRFSVKAGVQGEIGLFGDQWILTPGIYYDYGLTEVTSTEDWKLNTIFFQVDFRRAF